MYPYLLRTIVFGSLLASVVLSPGQNPIVRNQFTADPCARVFGGRVYLYPSHDILATPGKGRSGWFCMEDYHVFSSSDLVEWKDHGVIVTQTGVDWAKPDGYSMWAPDCVERRGKYYFYFPAAPKEGQGFRVGVAVADRPEGPFVPRPLPIQGVQGIDPNVFIDRDGQAYLYWASGDMFVAKLKPNMVELASEPIKLANLPTQGLKEGPFVFERKGRYYFTYPHVQDKTERLEYAVGKGPLGPFKVTGVIMDETPNCWTNHHSIVRFKGGWSLFYHANDLSPNFDKARSVRIDPLAFHPDGTIEKVVPTLRGVGVTPARGEIQMDRYTKTSDQGATVAFIDSADPFKGWKTRLEAAGSWVRYDRVDFGKRSPSTASIRVRSAEGATLQIRADGNEGPRVAEIKVPAGTGWETRTVRVANPTSGLRNLFMVSTGNAAVEVDWVRFG